jgi:hypothetical protein
MEPSKEDVSLIRRASLPLIILTPIAGFMATPERCSHWGFNYAIVPGIWILAAIVTPLVHFNATLTILSSDRGEDLEHGKKILVAVLLAVLFCLLAVTLGVGLILSSNPLNLTGVE